MSFSWRLRVSDESTNQAFVKLRELGFTVAKNGTEHTHPDFIRLLHKSEDQSSLAIRFQPEGVACIGMPPSTFYVEVKSTTDPKKKQFSVEKLAWKQYHLLHRNRNVLVLIFAKYIERWKFEWKWNFLEDIRLLTPETTLAKFPPEKRFPIVNGWIAPRGSKREKELHKQYCYTGSGTSYREVDPSSLLDFQILKLSIVRRLEANL